MPRTVTIYNRTWGVLATFPATEEGAEDANQHLMQHPDHAVLCEQNDLIYIVDSKDKGVKA